MLPRHLRACCTILLLPLPRTLASTAYCPPSPGTRFFCSTNCDAPLSSCFVLLPFSFLPFRPVRIALLSLSWHACHYHALQTSDASASDVHASRPRCKRVACASVSFTSLASPIPPTPTHLFHPSFLVCISRTPGCKAASSWAQAHRGTAQCVHCIRSSAWHGAWICSPEGRCSINFCMAVPGLQRLCEEDAHPPVEGLHTGW